MSITDNVIDLPIPFYGDGEGPLDLCDAIQPSTEEALEGSMLYSEIDDLDDFSNGIDDPQMTIMSFGSSPGYTKAMERAMILRGFLLKHGVPEVSIELQSGRPSGMDDWNACQPIGLTSHHTVSRPTPSNPVPCISIIKRGRSDVPGPLANGTAGVDLVYRIITTGYANHAGYGGPLVLSGPLGSYRIPTDIGRPYLWGTEYEGGLVERDWDREYTNKRTGKTMTFREFMGRANAGLIEGIWHINGRDRVPKRGMDLSSYHTEHKTWAPTRKIDRLGYTTDSGRAELRKWSDETLPGVWLPNMIKAANGDVRHPLPGVRRIQRALANRYGIKLVVTGEYDEATKKAYKRHQREIGNPPKYCDGIPGPSDLTDLGSGLFWVGGI